MIKGFTLAELVVSMALFLAFAAVFSFGYVQIHRTYQNSENYLVGAVSLVSAMEEIRDLSFNDLPALNGKYFLGTSGLVETSRLQNDLWLVKLSYTYKSGVPPLVFETYRSTYE